MWLWLGSYYVPPLSSRVACTGDRRQVNYGWVLTLADPFGRSKSSYHGSFFTFCRTNG